MSHSSKSNGGNFIGGQWIEGSGEELISISPVDDAEVWRGKCAGDSEVDSAFDAAREAFLSWQDTTLDERYAICLRFSDTVEENIEAFAKILSREMGKPLWEARTEIGAVASKVPLSSDAIDTRRRDQEFEAAGSTAVTRYKPFGVVGVLGPFNLPAHLPNGHIVPALLAGNTVVFKPSEQTPHVAQFMMELWQQAGLPDGVINMVHGQRDTGVAIVNHPQLDGLFFTGSSAAGVAINQALASQPQKIVALEMGGNNPLVMHECEDLRAAAYHTILSAYITSGQRCTCARRLILIDGEEADRFVDELTAMIEKIRVGLPDAVPENFMSTVISAESGRRLLHEQEQLIQYGAKPLIKMQRVGDCDAMLTPGLLDATNAANVADEELFGPLLQIFRVKDFNAAIEEANNTRYGLSAGLLSDNRVNFDQFIRRIRAGVVNWNRQTTGASGKLPFGGTGLSGNNRPAGYFAADYCSWPVASLEDEQVSLPEKTNVGIDL